MLFIHKIANVAYTSMMRMMSVFFLFFSLLYIYIKKNVRWKLSKINVTVISVKI